MGRGRAYRGSAGEPHQRPSRHVDGGWGQDWALSIVSAFDYVDRHMTHALTIVGRAAVIALLWAAVATPGASFFCSYADRSVEGAGTLPIPKPSVPQKLAFGFAQSCQRPIGQHAEVGDFLGLRSRR